MKSVGHQQHSVKDLSKEFIEHAERIGAIYAMAGDVSGWDTSWDERHLEMAQQLTGRIFEYYVQERGASELTEVKGRFVRYFIYAMHVFLESPTTA